MQTNHSLKINYASKVKDIEDVLSSLSSGKKNKNLRTIFEEIKTLLQPKDESDSIGI